MEPSPNKYIYKTTTTPKAQETFQKKGCKNCKILRIRNLTVKTIAPGNIRVVFIKLHQHDCLNMR